MFTQFLNGCKIRGALVLFGALSLTACGGGGGSSGGTTPTSVATSSTPVISSSSLSSASSLSSIVEIISSSSTSNSESSSNSSISSSSVESSSSSSVVVTSFLMGGAVQGSPLNIATVVTTFAGSNRGIDGIGTAAKFTSPYGSVVVDGNLYIADADLNTIRKVEIATGAVTTVAGSGAIGHGDGIGTAASFYSPHGITTDGTNLYIADTTNCRIRKVVIATGVVTTIAGAFWGDADGTGTAAALKYPQGITNDGSNLYVADTSNSKIRKIVIATGVVTTLAGSGVTGNVDGTGNAASFNFPRGIVVDGSNLYVADTSNYKIRKIVIATGVVTTLAGGSYGDVDGTGTAASFGIPQGIIVDGPNLYIADNNKIRKIVIATGVVATVAGSTLRGNIDGTGNEAGFNSPGGIAIDGSNLFIADTNNQTIRKIAIPTGVVTTLAGRPSDADGTGTAANFNNPQGITTDGTNLYVADTDNSEIRKIVIATGVVTTLAGSKSTGNGDDTGTAAYFGQLVGITTDGIDVYFTDPTYSKIHKIAIATGVVTTFAGGTYGDADGMGSSARFKVPRGITTDGSNLYIADADNHKIRKIVIATGEATTLAGSGVNGSVDGPGTAANFVYPRGITTDGTYLYVADDHKIRKIVIATGEVTTLAGSTTSGRLDGTGTAATFWSPDGVTTDGTNLYISDTYNNSIRKIVIATGVVTTLTGSVLPGNANGTGTTAQFNYPSGITSDGFELFVVDRGNAIRKIH